MLFCVSSFSLALAKERLASVRTYTASIVVEREGNPWESACSVSLVGRIGRRDLQASLKRPESNCSFFSQIKLTLSETGAREEALIVVEAARGGDGDHTGPILEFFSADSSSLKKLGELELFSAKYHRDNGKLQSISGRVLFSFCSVCDGPEAAEPADNLFVPVQVTIVAGKLIVAAACTEAEKRKIWQRFQQRKKIALREDGNKQEVALLERRLAELLKMR